MMRLLVPPAASLLTALPPIAAIPPAALIPMVVILLAALPCTAQDAFSRLSLRTDVSYNVDRNIFHDYWEPGYGGEVAVSMPFYLGEAEAGVALHRYEPADPTVPRFDAFLAFFGWGLDLSPIDRISWYNGFRAGNYRMAFDEDTFPGVRNESEFALGVHSRLDLHLSDHVSVYAAARYMQTYTFIRFRTAYAGGGLSITLDTPGWIRTFLR